MDKMGDHNPWAVENIEAFSFYCCPECDFKSKDGDHFERHALESHNRAKSFFIMLNEKKYESNTSNESEARVKEDSLCESEGKEFVRLDEHKAQSLFNSQGSITNDSTKTFTNDETGDIHDEKLKTFDNPKLEENVEEFQIFDGENFEDIADAETSDDETFDGIDEDKFNIIEEKNSIVKVVKKRKRNSEVETEVNSISDKKIKPNKLYECPRCHKVIATPSDLKRHIKTVHEKEKGHKCEICPSEFTRKNTLTNHIKNVHFFDRDFSCTQCDLRFSSRSNLKIHINEVHENIEYKCNLCNCSYKRKTRLKDHIKKFH
jgi:hypothetical protein